MLIGSPLPAASADLIRLGTSKTRPADAAAAAAIAMDEALKRSLRLIFDSIVISPFGFIFQ